MFLLPGVELGVEESVPDDLKTVYRHPAPLMSHSFLQRTQVGQGCDHSGQGRGSESDCLGLNPGSVTCWLMDRGISPNSLSLRFLTHKIRIIRVISK